MTEQVYDDQASQQSHQVMGPVGVSNAPRRSQRISARNRSASNPPTPHSQHRGTEVVPIASLNAIQRMNEALSVALEESNEHKQEPMNTNNSNNEPTIAHEQNTDHNELVHNNTMCCGRYLSAKKPHNLP